MCVTVILLSYLPLFFVPFLLILSSFTSSILAFVFLPPSFNHPVPPSLPTFLLCLLPPPHLISFPPTFSCTPSLTHSLTTLSLLSLPPYLLLLLSFPHTQSLLPSFLQFFSWLKESFPPSFLSLSSCLSHLPNPSLTLCRPPRCHPPTLNSNHSPTLTFLLLSFFLPNPPQFILSLFL